MSDEVELSAQQRYILRMLAVGFICAVILLFWLFVKSEFESSPAVNLWLMDFYHNIVMAIVYGILFIGAIISVCMGFKEREQ